MQDAPDSGRAEEAGTGTQVSAVPGAEGQLPTLREIEKLHIMRVLAHTRWNKRRTCAILQITRPTLDRKIREFALEKPAPDPTPTQA
jgi:two-component system response regulator AtoC